MFALIDNITEFQVAMSLYLSPDFRNDLFLFHINRLVGIRPNNKSYRELHTSDGSNTNTNISAITIRGWASLQFAVGLHEMSLQWRMHLIAITFKFYVIQIR